MDDHCGRPMCGRSNLCPDLVLKKNNSILVLGIAVALENELEALAQARQKKHEKYIAFLKLTILQFKDLQSLNMLKIYRVYDSKK